MKPTMLLLGWLAATTLVTGAHAQVYRLPSVPNALPPAVRDQLMHARAMLASELHGLQARAQRFNGECASVDAGSSQAESCAREDTELEGRRMHFNRRAQRYGREIRRARRLPVHGAMVWSVDGSATLRRGGRQMPADGHILQAGDCVITSPGSMAQIILPRATLFTFGAGGRFCYAPQRPDVGSGIMGYLYRLKRGHEVKIPIEVTGVRG